jgi:hypothetical protein
MAPSQRIFASLGILFCLAGGCTSTKSGSIGAYAAGDRPLIRHAPETAFYKVKWLSADRRELGTCADSERLIVRGEPVGFETGPNGQVTAIAGIYQFPLQNLPRSARYCQWNYKVKRETHFGQGMDAAGDVLAGSPVVAGLTGAGYEYLACKDGSDCDGGGSDHRASHADHDHEHITAHAPASRKSE